MREITEKSVKRSHLMYIFEAALEYFISILVAGSYLATLTKELGFSDSLTGILSSIISLGCLFQLLSLSIRGKTVKKTVVVFSILNQLLFTLLYVIPLTSFEKQTKIILFIILIFSAYLTYNLVHPKKISWLMSLVEDTHRGRFTANKEIFSLISGMIFSFFIGTAIDYFSETGEIRLAFIFLAIMIFGLMVLHSLTMLFTVEKGMPQNSKNNLRASLGELKKNKNLKKIIIVFILYYASTYISIPFYGTYQIDELGLNLKFVSVIAIFGSVSRILVSRFLGEYADKKSFVFMIEKCLIFLGASQLCIVFAVPSTGKIMFILYSILHGIALGGINSALINAIFDYAPIEARADSLAIAQAVAGLFGFLATLCISPLISHIQNNGNSFFGLPIYAQQLVTIIALGVTISAILYIRTAFIKNNKG